ncbi:phage major tail protein, TP901-1 family [Lactobacillus jensenii]|jgi:TP901-1 family phage major tail protein|uniref:phage major tail protein, TP901-1 family n=1 Tax=Lactobacillus TaxID=1578 RepID=UPI001192B49A|nr:MULTISPECIES: phage major tail protein, TP901-1 family [Lactobacillus]MCZ9642002.1 phage major tail protein, TP901-1 family [Lactobacillus jensenii]MCZ9649905.1 phage major tail protein, TP901-1 family [Lactobacillus mulieris]MCZ9655600.1 phage major tail protein, TP901-1 family [Lactobacillus iners]MCZ9656528.1 phage major tail protein, TP901-1 family [Lactobacillus jensenii]MCZ9660741.1 phage major tail protein, TP901-1 family [Lactobacillus jensenii]
MAQSEIQVLQGIDTLLYVRLLENAKTERAQLIPYQTSLSFDPQRDIDTTKTKSGNVPTSSSLETDLEVEFVNNISKVSDDLYDSLIKSKKIEAWIIHRKRKNSEGKYFAWYMRGIVSEDSNDNDPDDNSTRDVTFTIEGEPQRGWLTLPGDAQEELAYVFRGMGVISDSDTTGEGTAWKDADKGTGSDTPSK